MKFMLKSKSLLKQLIFVFRSFFASIKINPIVETKLNDFYLGSLSKNSFKEGMKIYSSLNGNKSISRTMTLLCRLTKGRMIFALKDLNGKIIGIHVFYFNQRDLREKTVHEGFIGIDKEYRGAGLAKLMRVSALSHFQNTGLIGISSRISKNNLGSLKSAKNVGFKVISEYIEASTKEHRYYMICKLNN